MKKFYFLIFTGVFILASLVSQAQVYSSIANNATVPGGPFTLDDKRFWGWDAITNPTITAPPNPCNNCTIIINSNVTMVSSNQTSSDPLDNGSTDLDDVVINGGSLKVVGGVTITIDTYIQFFNTSILIGNDETTAASVILNGQVDLNGTAVVRLANINSVINAANLGGIDPVTGPNVDYGHTSTSAGIFYVLSSPVGGYNFSVVLSSLYIGTASNNYPGNLYTFNCDDGGPNDCIPGIIYGPAMTSIDPTYGAIFGPAATLPVSLVQFLAVKNPDASIKLSWATAQEINSSSFEIERSADQGNWQNIGSVKAKGYSSTTANYSFTDQFPLAGNNYYRLKMVDLDGKFKYSKVVAVTSEKDGRTLVIYSNPFSDQIRMKVNVNKAQNLSLTVTDIIGKTYLKQSYNAQAGDNLINLVPAGAARGMYILHIQGSTYAQTVKLAKQ